MLRLYMVIGVTTGRILFYFPLLFNKSSPFYILNIYSASCRVGHMGNYIRNKKKTYESHSFQKSCSQLPNFTFHLQLHPDWRGRPKGTNAGLASR